MRAAALLWLVCSSVASAQAPYEQALGAQSPYTAEVRRHWYATLARNPWRAFGAELLLPGAGNYYVGLNVPAALTLALSCVGASLWIAGARRDRDALMWSGVGLFAGARVYGVVSAPVGAALLNRAFRVQLALLRHGSRSEGVEAPFLRSWRGAERD
ncbi:MAG TPA: hypothetical protein VFX59_31270 [Polyangiales bacterium]|nr:hypothetical protein [Polyangiales bacterium]